MRFFTRGAAISLAVAAILSFGVSTVAAGNRATFESFPLDDRWYHEEPTGEVFWFDVTGEVRIVTTADGRSSATVHYKETQTLTLDDKVLMQSRSVSTQHAMGVGEDTYVIHVTNRSRWTNEYGGGAITVVLQIVNGVVIVDHTKG